MTRYIFPAGNVGASARLRAMRFYRTATATRPITDLTEVDGVVDTLPIPNGVIVTAEDGSFRSFCGPDDLKTLFWEADGVAGRTAISSQLATSYSDQGSLTTGSGTTTVANGGTIAHGLGATPTGFTITPAIPGRIAAVTAVDATNLTVSLVSISGASVATPEQVTWTASY